MKKHESKVANIRVVLTRKPMPRGQITLLKALHEAGNEGLSKSKLAKKIRGGDEVGLTGVIGALGKRVNRTWQYEILKPGVDLLIEKKICDGELQYRMRPELREAIDGLPDLLKAFSLSISKILAQYYKGEQNWLQIPYDEGVLKGGWEPKTFENRLLKKYWEEVGGAIYTEVQIGNRKRNPFWPKGAKTRFLDGVRIPDIQNHPEKIITFASNKSVFSEIIKKKPVELIEVKRKLNRLVIGQTIAGHDMFEKDYKSGKITDLILCSEGDPALEWVCKERKIFVKVIPKEEVYTASLKSKEGF
jgi:hypothetical protein